MQLETELFYDIGDGFNQNNVIKKVLTEHQVQVEFDLTSLGKILRLRFDPFPTKCIVRNVQIFLHHVDESVEEVAFNSTADWSDNGYYFFLQDDPRFIVKKDIGSCVLEKLTINFRYIFLNSSILDLFGSQFLKQKSLSPEVSGSIKDIHSNITSLSSFVNSSFEQKDKEIVRLKNELANVNEELKEKEKEFLLLSSDLNQKVRAALNERFTTQKRLQNALNEYSVYKIAVKDSMSYKLGFALTAPVRFVADKFKKKEIPLQSLEPGDKVDSYELWLENNRLTEHLRVKLTNYAKVLGYQPLFSIVVPVYNVDEKWLKKLVVSVKRQIYTNWELLLVDDKSSKAHIKPLLAEIGNSDDRIKVHYRSENGNISAATNDGIEISQGEFIVFMDNDDEIHDLALFEMCRSLNEDKSIDVIYTDEDKLDEEGKRYNPHFKPEFSKDLLLSYNYLNHLLCVRKSKVIEAGMFRSAYDGTQDYDFILRLIEKTERIHHIPKILYHWRALSTSIAGDGASKSDSLKFFEKGKKSLEAYLNRNSLNGKVIHPEFAIENNLGLYEIRWPDEGPLVSIIVLHNNSTDVLKRFLESIQKTAYDNYIVNILVQEEVELESEYLNEKIRLVKVKEELSLQSVNDFITQVNSKYIVNLDERLLIEDEGWLSQLVGYAQDEDVGITFPKIYQPNGKVYSAGVMDNMYSKIVDNLPYFSFRNAPAKALGYFFYLHVTRNYSIASKECFLIKTDLLKNTGGFDAENFSSEFYSYDLSRRVQNGNKRIVFVGSSTLTLASEIGVPQLNVDEAYRYKKKYGDRKLDPYYNINFKDTTYYSVNPSNSFRYYSDNNLNFVSKVLFLSHNLNFEGAPLQILEIMNGLQAKGNYEFYVFSPVDGPLREEFEKIGVKVKVSEVIADGTLKEYNTSIKDYYDWVKKEDFDVVYANTLITFYGIHSIRELNIPTVWIIHESYDLTQFYSYLNHDIRVKAIQCFKLVDKVVFVAKATMNLFHKRDYKQSFQVINNALKNTKEGPVDKKVKMAHRESLQISEDKIVFLNLGSVCERKGQIDFVNAAVNLIQIEKITNVLFYIVGGREDDYQRDLEQIIETNNCEEYFRIVSETGSVDQYYYAADVFVCSSYIESYPRVILEAMNFGLPIISTPVFGITEQVLLLTTGEFYPPGSQIALMDKMSKFYRSSDLREKYANNAYYMLRLINSYDEMINKYHDVTMGLTLSSYKRS